MKKILKIVGTTLIMAVVLIVGVLIVNSVKGRDNLREGGIVNVDADKSKNGSTSTANTDDEEKGGDVDNVEPSDSDEINDSGDEDTESASVDGHVVQDFLPKYTSDTIPSKMIEYTNIVVNEEQLDNVNDYKREGTIGFGQGKDYTSVEGVITFRGNNFRNSPAYGEATMSEYSMEKLWNVGTGSMTSNGAYWSGSGWTGQPLLVKWPAKTKRHMRMYRWAKQDDDLVEAIYACMDGNIYFIDIRNGKQTRKPMELGFVFKGAGALDPRGYPIMYVGAGYDGSNGTARAFIINLLTNKVMYEFGNDDPFSLRGHLSFFDSSSLVDAETDTLIQPGENGILYLIKLNTNYDEEKGKLSINPDRVVKWRYKGKRSNSQTYWLGMESSAAIYKGYMFITDNGGHLMCLNLNSLRLRWVQDILDDSNSTPVLSVEGGKLYIYVSTSFHLGWRSSTTVEIPIWKIDAADGSIVWKRSYTCSSVDGASGGVQSTIAIGYKSLARYIYVTVGRTGGTNNGVLACISKRSGRVKWEQAGPYTWSSPVCVYNTFGKDEVLYARSDSKLLMVDGLTGETDSELELGSGNIEASPAVYNDTLVLGTRGNNIFGVKLK